MPTKKKGTSKRKKSTSGKRRKSTQSGKAIRGRPILTTVQKGDGVARDVLSAVHSIVKNNQLVSRGLGMTPLAPLAPVARMLGYGKRKGTSGKRRVGTSVGSPVVVLSYPKKKRSTARRNVVATPRTARRQTVSIRRPAVGSQYGSGFFSDLGGGVGNIFGGLGGGIGSVARGLFGGKKRGTQKGRGISI